MILSRESIQQYASSGEIKITPFDASLLKEASYTFTLDYRAKKLKKTLFIDAREEKPEFEDIDITDGYSLAPGEFLIGLTAEKISLGKGVGLFLSTRGSRAQAGLDVLQTSTFCEPGSDNQMVLEMTNTGPFTIKLFPGITIAKGVFITVK